jgi:hypothetical protein
MAYLPKNKYEVLYTNGDKYKLSTTNKPYIGKYIKLTNGKVFAGEDPSDISGTLTPLKVLRNQNIKPGTNNSTYSLLKPKIAERQDNYIPIPSSKPIPNALDYSKGYFNRYLSVKLNTKQYQEISQITFDNFSKINYNKSLNKVFQIEWSLNENNEDLNIKTLRGLEYQLPGIFKFFPIKSQFGLRYGIVKIGETSRVYPTGEVIPKSLPTAYQTGNRQINTIDNPNVPTHEYCGDCIFNQNGNCTKWQAPIKENYWCRAHKSITNLNQNEITGETTPQTPPQTSPPPPQQQSSTTSGGGSGY